MSTDGKLFRNVDYTSGYPPPTTQHPLVGQDLHITEISRSHLDTPHSAGLLWSNDQPDPERQTIMPPAGVKLAIQANERP
jgi:hypothetical protein